MHFGTHYQNPIQNNNFASQTYPEKIQKVGPFLKVLKTTQGKIPNL